MKYPELAILVKELSKKTAFDVLICSVLFAVFAYFINCVFPLKAIAFTALLTAAWVISQNVKWLPASSWREIFSFKMLAFYLIGFQMGTAGAIYYRGSLGMPVLPATIKIFSLLAVGIAIMEELVFRGFIQGRLSKLHPGIAIVFASFAHASYKACLFLSPAALYHDSLLPFYTWSFGAFILMGVLRYYAKSIVPAIIVHVVFDLIVYAENTQVPWWVW
jgi:membrane protease YdiL (CAAX protease family)